MEAGLHDFQHFPFKTPLFQASLKPFAAFAAKADTFFSRFRKFLFSRTDQCAIIKKEPPFVTRYGEGRDCIRRHKNMNGKELYDTCLQQEQDLVFNHFTRDDALELGLSLHHRNADYGTEIAIEITMNGLVVFRYFPEGTSADNGLWLARKRRTVELMEMSSLRFLGWLQMNGETLADRKLDPNEYAAGGGGFPIRVKGVGVIGSICVSGLAHEEDHKLIADTIAVYLKNEK